GKGIREHNTGDEHRFTERTRWDDQLTVADEDRAAVRTDGRTALCSASRQTAQELGFFRVSGLGLEQRRRGGPRAVWPGGLFGATRCPETGNGGHKDDISESNVLHHMSHLTTIT